MVVIVPGYKTALHLQMPFAKFLFVEEQLCGVTPDDGCAATVGQENWPQRGRTPVLYKQVVGVMSWTVRERVGGTKDVPSL